MRVWFVSTFITEDMWFNDAEPGESCQVDENGDTDLSIICDKEYCTVCYLYETEYDSSFSSKLFATQEAAVNERNRLFLEKYEKERKAHADRLARHNKRIEAMELLTQFGLEEGLFPYGIGDEPQFSHPKCPRIGYLEVEE